MLKLFISLRKLILIFLFSQFIFLDTLAQTDFRPGYIITNEADTILGLLDYRGDIRNCRICAFKRNENSETEEFLPGEISAYRFVDGKYYITKQVKIQDNPIKIFAEYLVDGIIDLFFYADINGGHYLLEQEDGRIIELDKEIFTDIRYENGPGEYQFEYKKYIGVLKATFSQCPQLFDEIDHTELSHKSLSAITKKYHDYICNDDKCIMYTKEIPVVTFDFVIAAGVNLMSYSIAKGLFKSDDYSLSIGPALNVNCDIKLPGINEKLSVFLETGVGYSKTSSQKQIPDYLTTTTIYYEISSIPVNFYGGLKYTYPKGKVRPFVGIGGGFKILTNLNTVRNITSENNGVFTSSTLENNDLDKSLPGFLGLTGFEYLWNTGRKASFNFEYARHGSSTNLSLLRINTFSFKIGYYF